MVKVPTNLVLGKNYLPDLKLPTFLYVLSLVCEMREKRNSFGGKKGGVFMVKTLMLLDQAPTLMSSFNFNYFLRNSISKYSHKEG